MEANKNVSDENCKKGFVADVEEEDVETLKRRISSHPLYGLLIQTHLNCLKVSIYMHLPIDHFYMQYFCSVFHMMSCL